jgi:bifunctional DNA-binding transcriptional regulator/antitoxin component of YhaV-PrlF toxin-antitoxin module
MTDKVYQIQMSTRGRITIPAAIRRSLGIRGGEAARSESQSDGSLGIIVDERAKP